jgi:hypothetical protein
MPPAACHRRSSHSLKCWRLGATGPHVFRQRALIDADRSQRVFDGSACRCLQRRTLFWRPLFSLVSSVR